ncbi:MAG: tetratricopeptide repeat protein [Thermodesulfobacteriota bacterium]
MDKKSKIFDKAQKYIQKGYLDRAIDEYRKVLRAKPGDVSTRLRVGDLFVKIGKEDEAIEEYHEVARTLTQNGFYLKAIAVYKQILKLDPPNLDMRYRLAELYARQDLIADAISEYDILARHFESKGKREDTLNIIKKMLEIDKENVGIRLRLAEIYEQSGFQEDATFEFASAAERLIEDGKIEKAEKLLLNLYNRGEKQLKVLEGLGAVAKEKGERELFLRYSRELIELYDKLGEVDKERELSTELLTLFPEESDVVADMLSRGEETSMEDSGSGEVEAGDDGAEEDGRDAGEDGSEAASPPALETEVAEEDGDLKDVLEDEPEETPEDETPEEEEKPDEPLSPWSEMIEIEDEPESSDEELSENEQRAEEVDEADPSEVEEVVVVDGGDGSVDADGADGESKKEGVEGVTGVASASVDERVDIPPVKNMEELFEGLLEEDSEPSDNSTGASAEELGVAEDDVLLDEGDKELFGDLFHGLLDEDVETEQEREEAVTVEMEGSQAVESVREPIGGAVETPDMDEPVEEIGEASLVEVEEEAIETEGMSEPELQEAPIEEIGVADTSEPAMATLDEVDEVDENAFFDDLPDDLVLVEEFDEFEEDSSADDVIELLEDESAFEMEDEGGDAEIEVTAETSGAHEHSEAIGFLDDLPEELEIVEEVDDNSLETVEVEDIEPEPITEEGDLEVITAEEVLVEEDAEVVEAFEPPDVEQPLNELPDDEDAAEEAGEDVPESMSPDSGTEGEGGYVDLSSELGLDGVEERETTIEEFHDGIERQLNREDTETHYNMGIAYMEMEMYDEAVREFNVALKDPNRFFDCQVRLGLSYMARGEPLEAIASYTNGLDSTGRTKDEKKGLMYELALAYESAENDERALKFFNKVNTIESGFRDVAGKLRRLKEKSRFLSIDDNLIEVELL